MSFTPLRFRCLWLAALACIHRSRLILVDNHYRLTKVQDNYLLVPPPLPKNLALDKPITIQLRVGAGKHGLRYQDCTISYGPFSIYPVSQRSGRMVLRLPNLGAWEQMLSGWKLFDMPDGLQTPLLTFLEQIGSLEQKGCIGAGAGLYLSQIVRESLPTLAEAGLFSKYIYLPGKNGLDLRPGYGCD